MPGRIAIIGNATPNHDFGEIIDRYDTVIRLNNFRVAGIVEHGLFIGLASDVIVAGKDGCRHLTRRAA